MSGIGDIKSALSHNVNNTTKIATGKNQSADDVQNNSNSANSTSDKVSLTDTATHLQALEKKISEAPIVNQDRVAEIKSAIAEGRYQIDSQELARKMIDFEGDF